jgi:hypothetical protein
VPPQKAPTLHRRKRTLHLLIRPDISFANYTFEHFSCERTELNLYAFADKSQVCGLIFVVVASFPLNRDVSPLALYMIVNRTKVGTKKLDYAHRVRRHLRLGIVSEGLVLPRLAARRAILDWAVANETDRHKQIGYRGECYYPYLLV